jgi:hypothetical protein
MSDILLCGAALAIPLVWWWRQLNKANGVGRGRGWWL